VPGEGRALTRRGPPPALFGLVLLWGAVCILALLGPDRANLVPALGAYTVAFLALAHLWRVHGDLLDDPRILLGGAVVLRLTLFPALPDLSDDLFRYIWDGWLLVSGVSPFRFVPSDAALAAFQGDPLYSHLNSPDFRSVYPPLSQLVFAPAGWAYAQWGWPAGAYVLKGGFLALEVTGVILLYRAVRALGLRPRLLALYAWNPLVLVVLAGSGHSEGGLVLGMGLLALGVASARPRTAWVGLALAVLSKGIPILLAPLLLRHQLARVGPRAALLAPLPGLAVGAVLILPFLGGGIVEAGLRSSELYVRLFEFNAGLYFLVKEAGLLLTGEDWSKVLGPALRLVFLGGAVWIWLRRPVADPAGWTSAALLVFGLYLATATTVHPWYLIWGLVLLPFTSLTRGAWLWASWAAFPTYLTYVGVPHGATAGLFWGGVAGALLLEARHPLRDLVLPLAGRRKARQVQEAVQGPLILDLGAGEGYVGIALQEPSGGGSGGGPSRRRVFAADITPSFRVGIPAVICRGEALPFRDGSVDTVLLSLVLHHCRDPDGVLAEALRVARRRVVITESTFEWEWERRLLEKADRWVNRGRGGGVMDRDPEPLRFRTPKEWERATLRAGGRVVESRRLNRLGHRHHLLVAEPFSIPPRSGGRGPDPAHPSPERPRPGKYPGPGRERPSS
jgi:SAM-dependent methyltransferase